MRVSGVQNWESPLRGSVKREKYGTGKYLPVFPGFPVLPNTLCRQAVQAVKKLFTFLALILATVLLK